MKNGAAAKPKLLDRVRAKVETLHYRRRTEQAYVRWIRRFIVLAILFLYRRVLGRELGWLSGVERAQRPERLPVVLTRSEVRPLLSRMRGTPALMASLHYGSGLRRMAGHAAQSQCWADKHGE
jgi:hypothetical protein